MTGTVWITGAGAISAAGPTAEGLLATLWRGESCTRPQATLGGLVAGRAPDPDSRAPGRNLDRSGQFFLLAAEEAWGNAGLDDATLDRERCAVIDGSSLGTLAEVLTAYAHGDAGADRGRRRTHLVVRVMPGMGGMTFAQRKEIGGAVFQISAGCVAGACALGEAYQRVSSGLADVVVAGGSECPLRPEIAGVLEATGILAAPTGNCLPFDERRSGTVLGEGAGCLVLESEAHARRRGAICRGVVRGYGLACETHSMLTPDPGGCSIARATRIALAGRDSAMIGWVKTHGTGTRLNDPAECRGLASVLGPRMADVELVSLKPALGHTLGASGGIEAVAAVLALEAGFVPATVGTTRIDPELPPCRVSLDVHEADARSALLLSQSFGGRCVALLLERAA